MNYSYNVGIKLPCGKNVGNVKNARISINEKLAFFNDFGAPWGIS